MSCSEVRFVFRDAHGFAMFAGIRCSMCVLTQEASCVCVHALSHERKVRPCSLAMCEYKKFSVQQLLLNSASSTQLAEHALRKRTVVGSIPTWGLLSSACTGTTREGLGGREREGEGKNTHSKTRCVCLVRWWKRSKHLSLDRRVGGGVTAHSACHHTAVQRADWLHGNLKKQVSCFEKRGGAKRTSKSPLYCVTE